MEKLKEITDRIKWTESALEVNTNLSVEEKNKVKAITYDNIKKIIESEDE